MLRIFQKDCRMCVNWHQMRGYEAFHVQYCYREEDRDRREEDRDFREELCWRELFHTEVKVGKVGYLPVVHAECYSVDTPVYQI